jgi:hypothetical protein
LGRIGIVAVHGVIPQARYGFQDQVAAQLCTALNNFPNSGGPWKTSVVFPSPAQGAIPSPSTDPTNTPTIARVHQSSEPDPANPVNDFFDIHEAYWSPIDKGKTTALRVLQWLLTTVFLPINDTARFLERFRKVSWDVGFLFMAILLGSTCFIASVVCAAWALGSTQIRGSGIAQFADALGYVGSPLVLIKGLDPSIVASLIAGFIGAYLAAQAIRAIWSVAHNLRILTSTDPAQLTSRIVAISILVILAGVGIAYCIFVPTSNGSPLRFPGFALVATVLLFQSGRALLLWFLANFFGDVQIYTTRDENSDFFALREQILQLVTETIISVANGSASGQRYDRVYVMAHSLGSTISLDALLRIYNAQKSGAVSPSDWNLIRAFVTFGTSLEKTKYFFSAWSPTQSQAYEEWQDDLYGPLFTSDLSALVPSMQSHGVYWLNCWYFSDFVSDEINSYRSYVLPGQPPWTRHANRAKALAHAKKSKVAVAGRLVADNRERFGGFAPWKLHFVTHGDYLGDQDWFWAAVPGNAKETGVIDILTSGLAWATPHMRLPLLNVAPGAQLPYESKPLKEAVDFLTPYVIKP